MLLTLKSMEDCMRERLRERISRGDHQWKGSIKLNIGDKNDKQRGDVGTGNIVDIYGMTTFKESLQEERALEIQ